MSTVVMSLLFAMEYVQWVENWTFDMWSWGFRQSNSLDRMAFRRQESSIILRLGKAASRIVGVVEILRSWKDFAVRNDKFVSQWILKGFDQKPHVRVPKRGSNYLVNNLVRSHNHEMSVPLNLGAVGIIWPASHRFAFCISSNYIHEFAHRALWFNPWMRSN